MSKRRPSKPAARSGACRALARAGGAAQVWLGRVFHNTYTRRGRRIAVRSWSVKMQHGGQRRAFSLAARTRLGAAEEARAIQEKISAGGWEEVVQEYSGGRARAGSKTNAGYWKERLLLRKYPVSAEGARPQEFSTRVEHAGTGCYFPLGTSDPEAAAVRALEIYRKVIEEGWAAAARSFRREVTLAFQWAYDPLLWTYITIHTSTDDGFQQADRQAETGNRPTSVLLVEADAGLRNALRRCVGQHEGVSCVACATAREARLRIRADGVSLCLVNRDLAGDMGLAEPGQVGALAEGIPAVSYLVRVDSEELFGRTPGGASGYVLKRTVPERILEPVVGCLSGGRVAAETLLQSAQLHFQRLLQSRPAEKALSRTAQLTQREQDVLNLMSKGYLDKEIARALAISGWTVHEHVKRIFDKLQVHSRTEAVLAYLQK